MSSKDDGSSSEMPEHFTQEFLTQMALDYGFPDDETSDSFSRPFEEQRAWDVDHRVGGSQLRSTIPPRLRDFVEDIQTHMNAKGEQRTQFKESLKTNGLTKEKVRKALKDFDELSNQGFTAAQVARRFYDDAKLNPLAKLATDEVLRELDSLI